IVLVIGSPEAEPAQPRALIGGHVVNTPGGPPVLKLIGPPGWAAGTAGGLSILAMYMTGTFHPPAGINPLLVVSNNLPWSFLFAPVLAGALLLTAFACLWHRWGRRQNWPRRWALSRKTDDQPCYSAGVAALASCSLNCPPSRTSTILRRRLVERSGGLVEEQIVRHMQQRPRQLGLKRRGLLS